VRQEGRVLRGGGRSRERARAAGPRQPVRSARQRPPVRSGADRDLALTLTSEGGAVIKAVDESGLNFPQMKVLVTLAGHEHEPASMKRIAEHLGISLASASRAVDALVKRDLATRIEDPDDRRVRHVSLTAEGQGIADELMAARLAGLEGFIATLAPPERRKLEAALEVLLRREDVGSTYRTHRRRVLR
jgi:DNA-binding MarR family transcriptional regulator